MLSLNSGRAKTTVAAFSLAMIAALLVAVVFSAGVAEAQRGGGGGGRGGGGGGGGAKPSGGSPSKPSSDSSVTKNNSAKSPSSGASSRGYGFRHGALSNFFLWAWIFHDSDDDDYEEEYGGTNAGFGGWAIIGVGAIAIFFLVRNLRRRFAA